MLSAGTAHAGAVDSVPVDVDFDNGLAPGNQVSARFADNDVGFSTQSVYIPDFAMNESDEDSDGDPAVTEGVTSQKQCHCGSLSLRIGHRHIPVCGCQGSYDVRGFAQDDDFRGLAVRSETSDDGHRAADLRIWRPTAVSLEAMARGSGTT